MSTDDRCGTSAGWNAHTNIRHEPPCPACTAAHAGYVTAYRQRRAIARRGSACGTEQGVIAHRIADENPCELCQAWNRAYLRGLLPAATQKASQS